ncbi:hypothetical protein TNCV_4269051 [Trichonephila clavipes]|nr:hypothetical protein TNCV_4269051 [Trichonephila clavipes]
MIAGNMEEKMLKASADSGQSIDCSENPKTVLSHSFPWPYQTKLNPAVNGEGWSTVQKEREGQLNESEGLLSCKTFQEESFPEDIRHIQSLA